MLWVSFLCFAVVGTYLLSDKLTKFSQDESSYTPKVYSSLAAGSPLLGIDPIERTGKPKLKLSLAAYSFRRQLTAKPGTPGAMDMLGFIDWASNQDLDAVEPTSYFFPKEVTPEYLAKLRRRAHLRARHFQRRHP